LKQHGEIDSIGVGINEVKCIPLHMKNLDLDYILVAMPYTLLDQEFLDKEYKDIERRGCGMILGSPYASGILATGPVPGAIYNYGPAPDYYIDKTRKIQAVCEEYNIPLKAAAIQFPLGNPLVASTIPGPSSVDQVKDN